MRRAGLSDARFLALMVAAFLLGVLTTLGSALYLGPGR
jgi:hypothetical protein